MLFAARNPIRNVAVLGAGTMGARIAAHAANAGLSVLLLDRVLSGEGDRNRLASQALELLKKSKPPALASSTFLSRIAIGNFEDDLEKLKDCDWVIEAVAEDLEIKRSLLGKVAKHIRPDAAVTTNTSGLPVALIAKELPEDFRRRWFGTHFFNPPRYMRLMEIIATPESDPDAVAAITEFADLHLGKTAVPAHDTRNFIANRIGTFAMLNTFRVMQQMKLDIEQVDALTGTPIGWPKTGTFRLADLVGIDVLSGVAHNFSANVQDERADVTVPALLDRMVERNWLGDKSGQGFYKKEHGSDGKESRLVLDPESMNYKPAVRPKLAELEMVKSHDAAGDRIRTLLAGNPERDQAARFYWQILPDLWTYAANRIGEVADNLVDIDRAMKAGFNWELGPFEMWDAAGVADTVEAMRARGQAVPAVAEQLLAGGDVSWYRENGREFFDPASGTYRPIPVTPGIMTIAGVKSIHGVVAKNAGASLVDVGDGIACIEFHSKMNSIGEDIVRFVQETLDPRGERVRNFEGFIVCGDAVNFSVGANLMQVLLAIQDEEWDELTRFVREFQAMTQAVKFCPRPVIAAPFGMCLGGGAEIALHATARQPHVELYMGLVETAVGLVPAGGGCKEMTLRAIAAANVLRPAGRSDSIEVNEAIRTAFQTIAMAKVSSSAMDARSLGLLREGDGITMNRDRLIADASRKARQVADAGYMPPVRQEDIPAPGRAVLATLELSVHTMREATTISDHDATIGRKLAHVLCGGAIESGTSVGEQTLLDLEREAFLSLCGEPKTAERIAFMLKTGKPLRN